MLGKLHKVTSPQEKRAPILLPLGRQEGEGKEDRKQELS